MFMKSYKFGITTCREVIDSCIGFWNVFRKKTLKFAVLDLFGNISAEIWIKQKLHNALRPSCYETTSFAKKRLKNLQSWHSLKTSLPTNSFPQQWAGQILEPFSDELAFFQHGLLVFAKLNLILLTSVNIRNRGN